LAGCIVFALWWPKNGVHRARANANHGGACLSVAVRVFSWRVKFVLMMRMFDGPDAQTLLS
jgi:hypothetical protein